jgi:molybdate transport system substrate-binding protein
LRKNILLPVFLIVILILAITSCNSGEKVILTVSAASSLVDAINEINVLYLRGRQNITILMNFDGSGTLEKQIENGAPVDLFISASEIQMDNLQDKNLIIKETRENLLSNKIVLIVPRSNNLGLEDFTDLTKDSVKKIAIGDPRSVPAGMYAKQVFDYFGIVGVLSPKLVFTGNVRQVLTYVESENVDAGIVFFSDVIARMNNGKVKIIATAPDEINNKIVYPVALVASTNKFKPARDYENFLLSNEAGIIFQKYGFIVLTE